MIDVLACFGSYEDAHAYASGWCKRGPCCIYRRNSCFVVYSAMDVGPVSDELITEMEA